MTDLFGEPIQDDDTMPKQAGELLNEIAPGKMVSHVDVWVLPTYVLSKLVPTGDGAYKLEVVDEWAGWVKATEVTERLGIKGFSVETLHRLCAAGFIEHCQPTPQIYLIKIDSLLEHMQSTKDTRQGADPYWNEQRRQLWSQACGF